MSDTKMNFDDKTFYANCTGLLGIFIQSTTQHIGIIVSELMNSTANPILSPEYYVLDIGYYFNSCHYIINYYSYIESSNSH